MALSAAVLLMLYGAAAAKPPRSSSAKTQPSISATKKHDEPSVFTITVSEHAGATGGVWPFAAGVPLPRGWVAEPSRLDLRDGKRALPVQARVLSRWSDGSPRWVLLDWQSELRAHGTQTFQVQRGTAAAAVSRVKTEELGDRIEVDTGALQFSVPKTRGALLQDVRLAGRPLLSGPVASFFVVDGKRSAAIATSARVIENGPLRVRIEVRGSAGKAFDYVARIDAYANQPYVRILHSFENHSPERYTAVQQIGIDVPLSLSGTIEYRAGRDGGPALEGRVREAPVDIYQEDNQGFHHGPAKGEGRLAGWVDLHDGARGVALVARYLWQEYPQSVQLRATGLTYNLWAPQAPVPAKVGMGAAKTHELVLHFHDAGRQPASLLEGLSAPVFGHVDAEWTVRSAALRNGVAPRPATKAFLSELGAGYARYVQHADREAWDDSGTVSCNTSPAHGPGERRRQGFYGMFNWGDWNFPGYHDDTKGCDAWGNLEYDMTQVLALAYAATGEWRYLDGMTAAARHFTDVDRIHYARERPAWVGMNHPKNPLHFAFELGGVDLGHTWTEGLLSYYAFTGDDRALDAARGIATYLIGRLRQGVLKGNPRQWGWPQIALVGVYEMTGDQRYRSAALEYARRGMKLHPPEATKDWKLGVLAEALGYTHSVTGDRGIADWLSRYAATVAAYPGTPDPRFLPAVAYVGRSASKPQYEQLATKAVPSLKFGNWGKPFTIAGRLGFAILAQSAEH
jgi:hypothetical protein